MSLPFSYGDDPLPEGSIRLLRILPDTDEHSPIQCQLFECTLLDSGSTHPYEALSYVWGSEDKPRTISIDNCDLPVGVNLHAALSHLRDRFMERIMWIDAICINQGDSKEKAHQVQSMAKIYAKANRVTVWLGEAAADSDQALEEIRGAADEQSPKSSNNETAILTLLRRPWFERIWVLQEVAAARHVLIKCGPTEIDGYAFCSGLSALKLSYDTCPGLQALIGSVAYLIRGAIFRPRYVNSQTGRFSLDIRPLSELVELYHTRKATKGHDKVYALIGMSSDPSVAGLSVNYDMPWEQLFQQLVNFFVSKQMSVDTWRDKEIAVMEGKGFVLGEVSSVKRDTASGDREILGISWELASRSFDMEEKWNSRWTLQALATPVQVGDVVCFLQGASRPTIVRLYDDYWAIIRIAVFPTDDLRVTSGGFNWPKIKTHFLLIWDWDMYPDRLQDREDYEWYRSNRGLKCSKTEWEDYLDKATRLQNVGLVLQVMTRHEEARKKLRKAQEVLEKALRSMGSQKLTYDGHSQSKGDVEKLEVVAGLLIRRGWQPLFLAAEDGHEAIVKLLLDTGKVDPDTKNRDGRTPLSLAAENGHEAIVKLLLDTGKVDPDTKNRDGRTPLSLAAEKGDKAIVKLLLDSGRADPDARDTDGFPPGSLWRVDWDGRTPLWRAAENGHQAIVKLLLDTGKVKPDAKDWNEWTPLWRAAENGHQAIVKLLLDTGKVDPDTKNRGGRTPLSLAAEKGDKAIVKLLLDSGRADPDTKNRDGRTPLSWAAENGHEAIVKLLQKRP